MSPATMFSHTASVLQSLVPFFFIQSSVLHLCLLQFRLNIQYLHIYTYKVLGNLELLPPYAKRYQGQGSPVPETIYLNIVYVYQLIASQIVYCRKINALPVGHLARSLMYIKTEPHCFFLNVLVDSCKNHWQRMNTRFCLHTLPTLFGHQQWYTHKIMINLQRY